MTLVYTTIRDIHVIHMISMDPDYINIGQCHSRMDSLCSVIAMGIVMNGLLWKKLYSRVITYTCCSPVMILIVCKLFWAARNMMKHANREGMNAAVGNKAWRVDSFEIFVKMRFSPFICLSPPTPPRNHSRCNSQNAHEKLFYLGMVSRM